MILWEKEVWADQSWPQPASIFREGVDRSHRSLRSFPPKKAARNNRSILHSIAKNALGRRSTVTTRSGPLPEMREVSVRLVCLKGFPLFRREQPAKTEE